MMTPLRVDVAIIGGGLVGSSAALALRRMGMDVALLDRRYCGAQASGVNYGGVRRQGRPPEQLPLSQRSHAIWPKLKSLIGIDGEFLRSGHLKLATTEADMASLEAYAAKVTDAGLELELIGHNELRRRFPWVGDAVGASFCPGDGHANPRLVATGFAAAARRAGVHVLENTPVTGVTRNGEGFVLEAGQGLKVMAGTVINSAGAWADEFAASFGEPVPLKRIYPSMIVTEPMAPVLTVNIGMEGGGIYARQVERGNCIVGGERGEPLSDPDFSRPRSDGAMTIMHRAATLFPGLAKAQAIRFWSGTEAEMPDRNPVLGPSLTTPGLIHAFGFSGAGFQIAPGVGEVLAELVRDGRTPTPIEAFSIARFTAGSPPARTTVGSGAGEKQEP
ncbi:NAD(P)/FAD-dependent oxidoreductase [Chelatococcus composti]|uniref:Sarcosine oxidase subunit beta n=1 Tax=Chelatococcus composti TaxID=1743235 RepID=A0A841K4J4_9HYPH|nr:FAD-dependent oxidoreductase [Chelatococcus composti]MBB6166920.1 sarcosine oxidase subunit beta [Chelatococcus composti]MBS7734156.1 FAD-binding oxidoreductase [Chelatococcus composti]GGG24821.1 FAD-binding oxidoreductase [Chelatococcus composti]